MRAAVIVMMLSGIAMAQDATTGALRGVVKDRSTGEPIRFATVVVTGTTTSPGSVATFTDDDGRYELDALPPANDYVVTIYSGNAPTERGNIAVELGKITVVNLTIATTTSAPIEGTIVDEYTTDSGLWGHGRTFESVLGAAAASQRDACPARVGPAVRHRRPFIDTHSTALVWRSSDLY